MTKTRTTSATLGAYLDVTSLDDATDDQALFGEAVETVETADAEVATADETVAVLQNPDTTLVQTGDAATADEPITDVQETDTTLVRTSDATTVEMDTGEVHDTVLAEQGGGDSTSEIQRDLSVGDDDEDENPYGDFGDLASDNYPNIHGDDFGNTLEGGVIDNSIWGYGGDDTLIGNGGVDYLYGGDGNDDLFGGDDHDHLHGGKDQDNLYGGAGPDLLFGNEGDDKLFGDAGDDEFYDNPGDDIYTGGEGADTFSFYVVLVGKAPGSGHDLIEDFELGVDRLQIMNSFLDPSYPELSFADYMDQHAFGQADPGVAIEWENGVIRLAGISKADLNPWDIELI